MITFTDREREVIVIPWLQAHGFQRVGDDLWAHPEMDRDEKRTVTGALAWALAREMADAALPFTGSHWINAGPAS